MIICMLLLYFYWICTLNRRVVFVFKFACCVDNVLHKLLGICTGGQLSIISDSDSESIHWLVLFAANFTTRIWSDLLISCKKSITIKSALHKSALNYIVGSVISDSVQVKSLIFQLQFKMVTNPNVIIKHLMNFIQQSA